MGLAMSLSLRRYMPGVFEDISLNRCLIDLFLSISGYSILSYMGMELSLENMRNMRKELVLESKNFPKN